MYGSEIWSIYGKDDYNSWERDLIEKTHLSSVKKAVGVNK